MRHSFFTASLLVGGALLVFSSVSFAAASVLTDSQIQAILSLVNSFGVGADVSAHIEHALRGIPDVASTTPRGEGSENEQGDHNGGQGALAYRHAVCVWLAENADVSANVGTRGQFVQDLQQFLSDQGFLNVSSTGFFGELTEKALGDWQRTNAIVNTEDKGHGWGIFGPRTRAFLQQWCHATTPPTAPGGGTACSLIYDPVCGQPPEPACRHSTPACMIATPGPRTYPNSCFMNAAGATLLYAGHCTDTTTGTTTSSFTPDASCRAWYDGCNDCARATQGGTAICTQRACVWQAPGYCTQKFETINKPPVISGFSGPTTLAINEAGTWTVNATDPENGTLSYFILWGDERTALNAANLSATAAFTQTTSFTHSFSTAGTYKIVVLVRDGQGGMAQATATVEVGGGTTITCTADAKQCSDGSWVGRTGPNCEFVCQATTTGSCVYGEQTYTNGQTVPGLCPGPIYPGGPIPGSVCSGPATCRNGQWVPTTQTTDGSCVAYGKIFPNGYVERNAFCNVHWQQVCLSAAVMFIPWTCANGQWVPTITPSNTSTYDTSSCTVMADSQTTSGSNVCKDLYCPSNDAAHKYHCSLGGITGGSVWSAISCSGISCMAL